MLGALAFPHDPALVEEAKLGVPAGSILSALPGYSVLRLASLHPPYRREGADQIREFNYRI